MARWKRRYYPSPNAYKLIIAIKRSSVAESFVDLIDLNPLIALFLQFPVGLMCTALAYHDKAY